MHDYDILVSMCFLSKENGGRTCLPPVEDRDYTYRPIFRLDDGTYGYCCGIVIGSYIQNYSFQTELLNVKILFLNFPEIKNKLSVGKNFTLYEGNVKIATGHITKIKE